MSLPQGMSTYNNRSSEEPYHTWKGNGVFGFPIGTMAGNIPPITNKDYRNNIAYKQSLARPIKHYRKGSTLLTIQNGNYYLLPMESHSSRATIKQMIDQPGQVTIRDSTVPLVQGVCFTADYKPKVSLSETPQIISTSGPGCCNAEKNALLMSLPPSTLVKKNYYPTHKQYLKSRCQTYDQKAFNFYTESPSGNPFAKPGSAEATQNTYIANCYATTCQKQCSKVVYKPNNPQFATQGGVSSSTRTLKLTVDTIEKNALYYNRLKGYQLLSPYQTNGSVADSPFIYKNKHVSCTKSCTR